MSENTTRRINRNVIVVVIPIVLLLLPIGYSLGRFVFTSNQQTEAPFLAAVDPQYESCVMETSYMRYHHWELLRQVREEVVRHGKRGDITFDRCRECHPDRGHFCNQCHVVANVALDCFGCHYYPESPTTAPPSVASVSRESGTGR
ncbi:MAG: hypothetical protein ABIF77_05955 [bacterium]